MKKTVSKEEFIDNTRQMIGKKNFDLWPDSEKELAYVAFLNGQSQEYNPDPVGWPEKKILPEHTAIQMYTDEYYLGWNSAVEACKKFCDKTNQKITLQDLKDMDNGVGKAVLFCPEEIVPLDEEKLRKEISVKVWCAHCVWVYQSPNFKRGNYLFKAPFGNRWVWNSWMFCPVCGNPRPNESI